ncbi:hypothetical protein QZH41_006902 [Actinostola sp. cb2023]|nr:hypothetical protein QZH41_006902 [Actinostola sp. cb2023]
MITPTGESRSRKNFYAACLFVLLLCILIVSSFVLSLLWDVVKIVLYKSALRYTIIKIVLLVVVLISAGIWSGVSKAKVGFILFLSKCLIVAWVVAFISSILGSLLLLCFVYNTVYAAADDQVDDDDDGVDKLIRLLKRLGVLAVVCLIFLIFSILSPIAFNLVGASSGGIAFAFLFPLSTSILLFYLFFRGSKEEGDGFVIQKKVVLLMSVVLIVIFCMALTINTTCGEECQLGPPTKSSSHMLGYNSMKYPPRVPGYPICNKKWSELQLGITDMAFLAATAYKISTNKTNIRNDVNEYFKDRNINWVVESVNATKPFFFHIRNSAKKVNIFSIRGTVDLRDWFENAKIWNEIAVFQLISVALPVQHLPFEFVAFFISISSSVDYLLHRSTYTQYFKPLEDYVKAKYNTSEEHFLVGHSLGGGLAKIIGSRNKIPAIAISSPGDIYNHVKFEYTLEAVQKYTTTVRAQNDPVTWIDRSGGLVQYVECANSGYVGEGCHPIKNTYCELKKKCHVTTRINYCPVEKETFKALGMGGASKPRVDCTKNSALAPLP